MANAQLSLVLRHIRKLAGDSKATDRQLLHRFATRHEEAAFEMLVERHGPAVLGLCRRVLRHEQLEQKPSAEVRQHVQDLLKKTEKPGGVSERLQRLRAVETLETIATPEAREVLGRLAKGAPEARLTQEAKASLERLAKRP